MSAAEVSIPTGRSFASGYRDDMKESESELWTQPPYHDSSRISPAKFSRCLTPCSTFEGRSRPLRQRARTRRGRPPTSSRSVSDLVEVSFRPRRGRRRGRRRGQNPTSSRSKTDLVEVRTDLVEVKTRPRRGQKPTSSRSEPTSTRSVTDLDEVKNRPRRGAQ